MKCKTIKDEVNDLFGGMDIYLFDQIARGRFDDVNMILDVGCGKGRNLHYFASHGCRIYGIDRSDEAIEKCQHTFPEYREQFQVGEADSIAYETHFFDAVICNAVLHFADNDDQFDRIINEIWRVLSPSGLLFIRLASSIGIETLIEPLGRGQFLLPDGSTRYLVDLAILESIIEHLNAELLDPIKTTNVQNLRCMTTLVLKKRS